MYSIYNTTRCVFTSMFSLSDQQTWLAILIRIKKYANIKVYQHKYCGIIIPLDMVMI